MRRYFITGGTGFVGRALVRHLCSLKTTLEITCLTRALRPGALQHPKLSYWEGDITNVQFPHQPYAPYTDVIHAAAEANDLLAPDKAQYYYDVVEGARRVFDWVDRDFGRHQPARLLFVSSGAVLKGDSVYCRAKRMSERLAPPQCTLARIYSLVGPEMPFNGQYALGRFIWQAVHDKHVRFYESGSVRSYLHVDDCAKWLYTIMNAEGGKAYDVGSDIAISVRQLAYLVANLASVPCTEVPNYDHHPTAQTYLPDTAGALGLGCTETLALTHGVEQALSACALKNVGV